MSEIQSMLQSGKVLEPSMAIEYLLTNHVKVDASSNETEISFTDLELETPWIWRLATEVITSKEASDEIVCSLVELLFTRANSDCINAAMQQYRNITKELTNSIGLVDRQYVKVTETTIRAIQAGHNLDWFTQARLLRYLLNGAHKSKSVISAAIIEHANPVYVDALRKNNDIEVLNYLSNIVPHPYAMYRGTVLDFLRMFEFGTREYALASDCLHAYQDSFQQSGDSSSDDYYQLLQDLLTITYDVAESDSLLRNLSLCTDIQTSLEACSKLSSSEDDKERNSDAIKGVFLRVRDREDVGPSFAALAALQRVDGARVSEIIEDVTWFRAKEAQHPGYKVSHEWHLLTRGIIDAYLDQPVKNVRHLTHIKDLLMKTDWINSESANARIQLHGAPIRRLYRGVCRLQKLRTLIWVIENEDAPRASLADHSDVAICPIHASNEEHRGVFLDEILDTGATLQLNQRGVFLFQQLAKSSFEFRLDPENQQFLEAHLENGIHSWQQTALNSWAAHGRQGLVSAATGSGKSLLGVAALLESIQIDGASVLLTHRLALKGQWKKDELKALPGAKDIRGNSISSKDRRFLADGATGNVLELSSEDVSTNLNYSLQPHEGQVLLTLDKSLSTRLHLLPSTEKTSLLVADEVHRFNGPGTSDIITHPYTHKLGLSATIDFNDFNINNSFGDVVCDYDLGMAIRDNVIAEFDLLTLRVKLVSQDVIFGKDKHGISLGDETPAELPTAEDIEHATNDLRAKLDSLYESGFNHDESEDFLHAVNRVQIELHPDFSEPARAYMKAKRKLATLQKLFSAQSTNVLDLLAEHIANNHHTLIFANWNSEGARIEKQLKESAANVRVEFINADTEQIDRENSFVKIQNGESDVLIAPRILDEGINIPNATMGIILGPGIEGYRQIVQRSGRVLRKKEDGRRGLIVVAAAIGTTEDPHRGFPDSTHAILDRFSHKTYIIDASDVQKVSETLSELPELA